MGPKGGPKLSIQLGWTLWIVWAHRRLFGPFLAPPGGTPGFRCIPQEPPEIGVPPLSITFMDPGPWLSPELYIMGEVTNSSYMTIR